MGVVSVDDNDCDSMADGCLGLTDIRKFCSTVSIMLSSHMYYVTER